MSEQFLWKVKIVVILAIDEAHECVINWRLKQIISRPSAFRTEELADFMSYMDTILQNWSIDSVKVVCDISIYNLNRNEHGEADYAIWYHVTKSCVS